MVVRRTKRGRRTNGRPTKLARLAGKVETHFDTARRLFTLICVLQMRG